MPHLHNPAAQPSAPPPQVAQALPDVPHAAADGMVQTVKLVALGLGFAATVAVTILVSRKARQMLHDAGVDAPAGSNAGANAT